MSIFSSITKFFKRSMSVFYKETEKIDQGKLQEKLVATDFSPKIAHYLCEKVCDNHGDLESTLKREVLKILRKNSFSFQEKQIFYFIGMNGAGKTHCMFKMAAKMMTENKKFKIIAADTFRVNGREEVIKTCQENNFPVISADFPKSSAIIFHGIRNSINEKVDYILSDLSGACFLRNDLLAELQKVIKTGKKAAPQWDHVILLVIDATLGQGFVDHLENLTKFIKPHGVIMTKLDLLEKPGIIITIGELFPIFFCTYGEDMNSMKIFNPSEFVDILFPHEK